MAWSNKVVLICTVLAVACGDDGAGDGSSDGSTGEGTNSGSATSNASTGVADGSSGSPSTGSAATDSTTEAGDTATTDGPTLCPDDSCAVDCEQFTCGDNTQFDAQGCARPGCGYGDECGADERCFVGELFGQCVSSGLFCEWSDASMSCECSGPADCGGGFCVDAASYPDGEPGPSGGARVENGCAPNDGPAKDFQFGLDDSTCEAGFTPKSPSLWLSLFEVDGPVTGTFTVGIQSTSFDGQGWYTDGSGGDPSPVWYGTLTITTWDESGVSGSYEIWAGKDESGAYGHYEADFDSIPDCELAVPCG